MIWKTLWKKKSEVYIDDAALLILGINPDEHQDEKAREKLEDYNTVLNVLYEAVDFKRIRHEYVEGRKLFSNHVYLLNMTSLHSWLNDEGIESDFFNTQKTPADELSQRERTSLLKIIITMAVNGYRFDPACKKSSTTKEIQSDMEQIGLKLDEDTIRKYLKEAAQLLDQTERS